MSNSTTDHIHDITQSIAKEYAVRIDQKVLICIKPKPRWLTQKAWLKIASLFIYIEKTEPSMSVIHRSV